MSETPRDHVDRVRAQWRAARPHVDTSPIEVIGRLARVNDAVREQLISLYREFGLGEGEFDVLATLRRSGELNPTELAAQTMVTSGAVSKRLDRLESAGLVRRRGSDVDGRGRVVALTEDGRALIDRAFDAHMENERRLLASLDAADRDALVRILRKWGGALGT